MTENTCPKCGYDKNDPCCSFVAERDDLRYQLKMEQSLRTSYSIIIKRLEEKLKRLEQPKKDDQEHGEVPKETASN